MRTQACLLLVALGWGSIRASSSRSGLTLTEPEFTERAGRSLVNTFPFNSADTSLPSRVDRQGGNDVDVDFASVAAAGKRCIDKVEMVEETEYDEEVLCDHSYDRRCHTSYTTTYSAQQEEECDENYKKSCFIEYSKTALQVEVQICVEPLVKDCDAPGPEVCSTEYQSECETLQEEHDVEDDVVSCETVVEEKCEDETSGYTTNTKCSKWPREVCSVQRTPVKKFTPDTRCQKVPVELCGPSGCGVRAGPQECRMELRTIPGEKPEEQCTLEPQRQCKHVTKLVPALKPHESCTDVPKEVCTRSRTNPRKVKKPVVKKWCYEATPESGLQPESSSSSQAQPAVECSSTCRRNIQNNVCSPECDVPECPPCYPPPPTCSATCLRNIENNVCSPECDVSECPPCSPPPPPTCSSTCQSNIRNNICSPECDVPECPPCYPPPPPPKTTPPPPPTCSSTCLRNIRNNVCSPQCDVPECPPCVPPPPPQQEPPTCSSTCLSNIRNGVCKPECNVPECPPCSPPPPPPPTCSATCKRNIRNNVCKPECEVPECPPCSAPLEPPGGYLPPPATNYLAGGRERARSSNGRNPANRVQNLPGRNKFARKQKNARLAKQSRTSSRGSANPAPKSRKSTNWDTLFAAGVVKNRSRGRLRTRS